MTRFFAAALLFGLAAIGFSQSYKIAPIEIKPDPRYPEFTREEAKKLIASAVVTELTKRIEGRGWAVSESGDRILAITVLSFDHRNRSASEMATDPRQNGSETKVEIRVLLQGVEYKSLKGTAKGPYFGTTDRTDLSGAPADKTLMIRLVGRQKARAISQAVWDAIKTLIPAKQSQ